jgi:hypothetical protein
MTEQRTGASDSSNTLSDFGTWSVYVPLVGVLASTLMTIAGFAVQKPILSETIFVCLIAFGIGSTSAGGFFLAVSRRSRDLRKRQTVGSWIFVISGLFALFLAVVPYQLAAFDKLSTASSTPLAVSALGDRQLQVPALNLIYVTSGAVDERPVTDLKQRLQEMGFNLTDDATAVALKVRFSATTSVKPGAFVHNNQVWQAVTSAELSASDGRDPARVLSYPGHGSALSADDAADKSLDDAISHLVTEFAKVTRKDGS